MKHDLTISSQNSILFLSDEDIRDPPDFVEGATIMSTRQAVSIVHLAWVDGDTRLIVGDPSCGAPARVPDFDGMVETPSRMVIVSCVEEDFVRQPVAGPETRVRIWLSRKWQPDEVVIGLG